MSNYKDIKAAIDAKELAEELGLKVVLSEHGLFSIWDNGGNRRLLVEDCPHRTLMWISGYSVGLDHAKNATHPQDPNQED